MMTTPPNTELVSSAEAARLIGLAPQTLKQRRSQGTIDLPYYRVGRRIMYDRHEVEQWLERRRVEPISA